MRRAGKRYIVTQIINYNIYYDRAKNSNTASGIFNR